MDVLNEYWQLFHTLNHLQTEALTHKAPEPAVMQRWKVREAETDRETELSDANSGSPGVARPCRSAALFCAAQTLSQALSCLPVSPLAFLLSVSTSLFFFLSRPLLPRSRQKSKTHPKSSGFPPPSQTERGAHTKCVWRQKAYINLTPLCSAGSEMILSDQRVYLFNISSWPTHCFFDRGGVASAFLRHVGCKCRFSHRHPVTVERCVYVCVCLCGGGVFFRLHLKQSPDHPPCPQSHILPTNLQIWRFPQP